MHIRQHTHTQTRMHIVCWISATSVHERWNSMTHSKYKSNERMCVYVNVFANNKFSLLARHFGQQNSVSVIISNLTLSLSRSPHCRVRMCFVRCANIPIRNVSLTSVAKAIAHDSNAKCVFGGNGSQGSQT